jgi:molecular chaperone GrpE
MVPSRKPHVPGVAPGEPEAPVAASQAAPAPTGPNSGDHTDKRGHRGRPHSAAKAGPAVTPEQAAERAAKTTETADTAQDADAAQATTAEPVSELDPGEIAARAQKADQYLELAQRTKADFENYRRRAAREAAAAQERGVAKLARELLPAVDNLDRAVDAIEDHGEDGSSTLVSGIKLVHADVIAALARAGIERFSPMGERFDPQRHEAIAQQPVEGAEPGTIVEVYQRGYVLGDFVIRPARVVVAG